MSRGSWLAQLRLRFIMWVRSVLAAHILGISVLEGLKSRRLGRCGSVVALLFVAGCAAVGGWLWTTRNTDGARPPAYVERAPVYGESALQEMVTSLRNGDVGQVLSRLSFKAMPCGIPLEIHEGEEVPGPECQGDEVLGTTVAVFPVVTCNVQFVRSDVAAGVVRNWLKNFEVYGAIKLRHPIRHSPYAVLQGGFYGIAGTAEYDTQGFTGIAGTRGKGLRGVMVSMSFDGGVVNLWPGCGEFASGLTDDRFREALLLGPFR